MKSSRPSLRETRDKRPLGRDPDRSWCHRHTMSMIKLLLVAAHGSMDIGGSTRVSCYDQKSFFPPTSFILLGRIQFKICYFEVESSLLIPSKLDLFSFLNFTYLLPNVALFPSLMRVSLYLNLFKWDDGE